MFILCLIVVKGSFLSNNKPIVIPPLFLSRIPGIIIRQSRLDLSYQENKISITTRGTYTLYISNFHPDIRLQITDYLGYLASLCLSEYPGLSTTCNFVNTHLKGFIDGGRGRIKKIVRYILKEGLFPINKCRDIECGALLDLNLDNLDIAFAHSQFAHFISPKGCLRLKFGGLFTIISKQLDYLDFWEELLNNIMHKVNINEC